MDPIIAFVKETDWSAVGRSVLERIGEALGAGAGIVQGWVAEHIVGPVAAFITETDWSAVGRSVLERIGEALGAGVEIVRGWVQDHIVGPVAAFITETDWSAVGQSILTKIGEVWEGVKTSASEKLGELFGTLLGPGTEAPAGGGAIGVLDAITGFVGGPGGTAISVIGAIVGLITGIGAPIAIAIGAVKLLSMAWQENFGGIREFTAEAMGKAGEFISETIGRIEEVLTPFFEGLQEGWAWIKEEAIPTLRRWGQTFMWGLQPHLDKMGETLEQFWKDVGPKVQKVWDKLEGAWKRISGVVMEKLWPALQDLLEALGLTDEGFGDLIGQLLEYELDGLLQLITWALDGLVVAIEVGTVIIEGWVEIFTEMVELATGCVEIFNDVSGAVGDVSDAIDRLSKMSVAEIFEELTGIELPEWLKPGSPPPLYYALMDVGKAMDALSGKEMPAFGGLEAEAARADRGGGFAWTSYAPIIVEGVQDGRGFLEELQALAV